MRSKSATRSRSTRKRAAVFLAGGNPQIAKAEGDGPVQTYISAMPGWKREAGGCRPRLGRGIPALGQVANPDRGRSPRGDHV
jgi:hypothetical protein